jgi:hypothetical protein
MTLFYDHLIDLPALDAELAAYLPDPTERAEVLTLVDQTLHHVVMDTIFTAIPVDQHEVFLVRFHEQPDAPTHLEYLRQYQPEIEDQIRLAAEASKRQFIDTIHAS